MSDRVVVDASALLPLVLPDTADRTDHAVILIERASAGRLELVIPQVCHLELASVLARKVRSKAVARSQVEEFFAQLDELGVQVFMETLRYDELFEQAMFLGCQVADSIYVRLAHDLDLSLATLDSGMRQAARASKVAVYAP